MRNSAQFGAIPRIRRRRPPARPTDRRALAPLRSPKLLDDDDKKVEAYKLHDQAVINVLVVRDGCRVTDIDNGDDMHSGPAPVEKQMSSFARMRERSKSLSPGRMRRASPPEKKHSDDGSPLRPSQAPGYDQALSEQSMGMTSGIRAKRDEPYDSTRDS